jgi:hypothetical protein
MKDHSAFLGEVKIPAREATVITYLVLQEFWHRSKLQSFRLFLKHSARSAAQAGTGQADGLNVDDGQMKKKSGARAIQQA